MKELSTRRLLIIVLVVDVVLCGALFVPKSGMQVMPAERQLSESNIRRICELATLECFYHNVSKWSTSGNFIGYGAKRLWLEYDGIVRVGVNATQIKISEPDKDGIVTVTIPEAVIIDKDLDEESIREYDGESPMWNFLPLYSPIKTEERKVALAEAQEDMVTSASQNSTILDEARGRAKKIIEKNIVAIGEMSGKHYKVKFSDASEEPATLEVGMPSPTGGM